MSKAGRILGHSSRNDKESSHYYLQSRYYDPELGRFINADNYPSTGQGLLGNNMFAYCNNSPIAFDDSTGHALRSCIVAMRDCVEGTSKPYITDQDDASVGDKPFGLASVSHGGCGAVASYNALVTMGYSTSFDEVLAYYNSQMGYTLGFGLTGLLPYNVAQYFTTLGFTVVTTNQREQIDLLSKTADGCIMYYKFPRTYNPIGSVSFNAYGAHFVEYHREASGYVAVNTNGRNGMTNFTVPSIFGYGGTNYGAIGIFIFE